MERVGTLYFPFLLKLSFFFFFFLLLIGFCLKLWVFVNEILHTQFHIYFLKPFKYRTQRYKSIPKERGYTP